MIIGRHSLPQDTRHFITFAPPFQLTFSIIHCLKRTFVWRASYKSVYSVWWGGGPSRCQRRHARHVFGPRAASPQATGSVTAGPALPAQSNGAHMSWLSGPPSSRPPADRKHLHLSPALCLAPPQLSYSFFNPLLSPRVGSKDFFYPHRP